MICAVLFRFTGAYTLFVSRVNGGNKSSNYFTLLRRCVEFNKWTGARIISDRRELLSNQIKSQQANLLNNKGLDASYKLPKHSIRIKPTSVTCIHC